MDHIGQQLKDEVELMEQLMRKPNDKDTDNYVRCDKCGCAFFVEYSLETHKQDGIILRKEDDAVKKDYRAADPMESLGTVSRCRGLECSQCKTWYIIDKHGTFIRNSSSMSMTGGALGRGNSSEAIIA